MSHDKRVYDILPSLNIYMYGDKICRILTDSVIQVQSKIIPFYSFFG